jgi:hypothetical protein
MIVFAVIGVLTDALVKRWQRTEASLGRMELLHFAHLTRTLTGITLVRYRTRGSRRREFT